MAKKASKRSLLDAIKSNTGMDLDPKSARQAAGTFLTEDPNLLEEVLASKRVDIPKPKPDVPSASKYFKLGPSSVDEYGKKAFNEALSANASKMPVPTAIIPEVVDDVAMPLVKRAPGLVEDAIVVGSKTLPKAGVMGFLSKHGGKLGLAAGTAAALYGLTREDKPNVSAATKAAGSDENKAPESQQPETIQANAQVPTESEKVEDKAATRVFEMPDLKFDQRTLDIGTREGPSDLEMIQAARTDADKTRNYAALTSLSNQFGKALSGGNYELDNTIPELMNANADRLTQNAKENIALQERDPNSPASKLYKQLAAQMGFDIKGDMTAAMGKEILPQLQATYEKEMNRQLQLAQLQGSAEERDLRRAERQDARAATGQVKLDARQDKFIDTAFKALSKPFEKVQKIQMAKTQIEQAVKDPNGVNDINILYNFIKILDPDSTVREGEIKLSKEGMSVLGKAKAGIRNVTRGDILDPTFREKALQMADSMQQIYVNEYEALRKPLENAAVKRGITKDRFNEFDPMHDMGMNSKPSVSPVSTRKIKVREKATGRMKLLEASTAEKVLQNPAYERVE